MAKSSTSRKGSRNSNPTSIARHKSHKVMEGLFLLSALGILCILFSFFALELQDISTHALEYNATNAADNTTPSTPPRIETRVLGSTLVIAEIDASGNLGQILYQSDLTDDIADFTLFAVPQTGYRGYIYLRPLLDGSMSLLKVYPLEVSSGTLKAAVLNIPADFYVLSGDGTLVGAYANTILTLYALEDGAVLASEHVSSEWAQRISSDTSLLTITENSCLTLSLPVGEMDIPPYSEICP